MEEKYLLPPAPTERKRVEIRTLGSRPGVRSEKSKEHSENQDTVFALWKEGLCGVFDGAGGEYSGYEASQAAALFFQQSALKELQISASREEMEKMMKDAFIEANKEVFDKEEDPRKYTTASVVKFWRDSSGAWFMTIGNNGNSRVLLYSKKTKELEQITLDSNFPINDEQHRRYQKILNTISDISELDALTDLSSEEIGDLKRFWRERNSVIGFLGSDIESDPTYREPRIYTRQLLSKNDPMGEGYYVLIVSDGVYHNLTDAEILEIIKKQNTPQETADAIVAKACKNNKIDDDMTAVVFYANTEARKPIVSPLPTTEKPITKEPAVEKPVSEVLVVEKKLPVSLEQKREPSVVEYRGQRKRDKGRLQKWGARLGLLANVVGGSLLYKQCVDGGGIEPEKVLADSGLEKVGAEAINRAVFEIIVPMEIPETNIIQHDVWYRAIDMKDDECVESVKITFPDKKSSELVMDRNSLVKDLGVFEVGPRTEFQVKKDVDALHGRYFIKWDIREKDGSIVKKSRSFLLQ